MTSLCACRLLQLPLFDNLEDAFMRHICRKVEIYWFLPGDYIAMKGNAGHMVYYIQRGEVRHQQLITSSMPHPLHPFL